MALGRIDDVGPATVVEGHLKQEFLVVCGCRLGLVDDGDDVIRQSRPPPQHPNPDPGALQALQVARDIGADQPHQV